jgi:hypothetical protein
VARFINGIRTAAASPVRENMTAMDINVVVTMPIILNEVIDLSDSKVYYRKVSDSVRGSRNPACSLTESVRRNKINLCPTAHRPCTDHADQERAKGMRAAQKPRNKKYESREKKKGRRPSR